MVPAVTSCQEVVAHPDCLTRPLALPLLPALPLFASELTDSPASYCRTLRDSSPTLLL